MGCTFLPLVMYAWGAGKMNQRNRKISDYAFESRKSAPLVGAPPHARMLIRAVRSPAMANCRHWFLSLSKGRFEPIRSIRWLKVRLPLGSILFSQQLVEKVLQNLGRIDLQAGRGLLENQGSQDGEVTILLREWEAGKPEALDRLFGVVYPELRRIAGALFQGGAAESLLQPTSVVNELFLKLIRQRSLRFEDRTHFYSLCARLMRRVLIDQARSQKSDKRDIGLAVPFEEALAWIDARPVEVLDLDRALDELEALDPRKCRMVEFRFLLGFTSEETAELMNVSKPTVDRDLRFARAWLCQRLEPS